VAGNILKEVAVKKAKGNKRKLMWGMAGVGAIVGTIASGAAAVGLIAGGVSGAVGYKAGNKHVQ
jgi:hypothetical protein